MQFNDVCASFLEHYQLINKYSSWESCKSGCNNHIISYFNKVEIQDIEQAHIYKWMRYIEAKRLATKTNNKILSWLREVFRHAEANYNISDVTKGVPRFKKKIYKKKQFNVWSIEQFNKFSNVVDNTDDALIFELLFTSGMRIGELQALQVDDIDYMNDTVTITKTFENKSGRKVLTPPKSEYGERTIVIPNNLVQRLKHYAQHRQGYLFTAMRTDSEPLPLNTIRNRFNRYIKHACVPRIRIHDLRHSHATQLIFSNVNALEISRRLGHSSIGVTFDTYGHIFEKINNQMKASINNIYGALYRWSP